MSVSQESSVVTGTSNQHPLGMSSAEKDGEVEVGFELPRGRMEKTVGRKTKAQGAYRFELSFVMS